jgi:hypothetical protein
VGPVRSIPASRWSPSPGTSIGSRLVPWLNRPRRMRSIGGGHPPSDPGYYRHRVIPATSFDGLIFIQLATPTRLNPTVTR